MDKADSMQHEAYLPPSYWEFVTSHVIHLYNQTPIQWFNWHASYELPHEEQLDINHLCVFACGAYMYLSPDIWKDKLSAKSEMITYLGVAPRNDWNSIFIYPTSVVFTSTHALFNETFFPHCTNSWRWAPNTPYSHEINSLDDEVTLKPDFLLSKEELEQIQKLREQPNNWIPPPWMPFLQAPKAEEHNNPSSNNEDDELPSLFTTPSW